MGRDTEEMLAIRYPNSYHLFPALEQACGIVKSQNKGKADVRFSAQGIDLYGKIIVKCFKIGMDLFLNLSYKDRDNEPSN